MNKTKKYDVEGIYNIKIYIGNYSKKEFYSEMGEFFADRVYRKKLPYLINDDDKVWYLVYEKNKLIGFFGIKICNENTLISDIYLNDKCDNKKVFKYMAEYLVNLYNEEELKVLTKVKYEQAIWESLGFKMVGNKGNYSILIRESK